MTMPLTGVRVHSAVGNAADGALHLQSSPLAKYASSAPKPFKSPRSRTEPNAGCLGPEMKVERFPGRGAENGLPDGVDEEAIVSIFGQGR